MPFNIIKKDSSFLVTGPYKDKKIHIYGTHSTKEQAKKQQQALYSKVKTEVCMKKNKKLTKLDEELIVRELIKRAVSNQLSESTDKMELSKQVELVVRGVTSYVEGEKIDRKTATEILDYYKLLDPVDQRKFDNTTIKNALKLHKNVSDKLTLKENISSLKQKSVKIINSYNKIPISSGTKKNKDVINGLDDVFKQATILLKQYENI